MAHNQLQIFPNLPTSPIRTPLFNSLFVPALGRISLASPPSLLLIDVPPLISYVAFSLSHHQEALVASLSSTCRLTQNKHLCPILTSSTTQQTTNRNSFGLTLYSPTQL